MSAYAPAILGMGLVTSVGLTAKSGCAAIRAKATNPFETRFIDSGGEWIRGHRVPLEQPWSGRTRLKKMATRAIRECLEPIPETSWPQITLLLCVAERERPGRTEDIEDNLLAEVCAELGVRFAEQSQVIPRGRLSGGIALLRARQLLMEKRCEWVLIAATDSLLSWPTVSAYESNDRLLTSLNSNGFLPGEGASAILLGHPSSGPRMVCIGLGFGQEPAPVNSEAPLRADGLVQAIGNALGEAGCQMHDIDLRIADVSGEHYYFKEAALAMSRLLRVRKEEFPIWLPAECIGECGAANALVSYIVACVACEKGYAPGTKILCQAAGDNAERAAAIFEYRTVS